MLGTQSSILLLAIGRLELLHFVLLPQVHESEDAARLAPLKRIQ